MTQIGTVIEGKYEILKEIGRGGMSVVYLANDTHLNRNWAVKEVKKSGNGKNDEVVVNSLLAEANMIKKLDHPALPRIVDIIDNGLTIYIVMDFIEGESIDKILNEFGAQSEDKVISWAMQICDVLSYLHSQKPPIIYRDMKPANLMLKPNGNISIIDFGIAREYKEQNLADTTVLGTKGYAPPEQYSGQTDPRSDIFALGMTMHHLLTGVDPRKGEPYSPVRMWNPTLSEGIEIIIDKCVQPAAENRYQSCADLLYDLEHPELITSGFKKKQKIKLSVFFISLIMCILTLVSGFAFMAGSISEKNNNYETYISATDDINKYKKAIDIYPNDVRAYDKILDTFTNQIDEGEKFTDSELKIFESVYSPNDEEKILFDPEGFAQLNYRIASLCFTYYSPDGEESFAGRINKAYTYLNTNHDYIEKGTVTDFESKNMSECYYEICVFYKKYILSQTADEASESDYRDLFDRLYKLLELIETDENANKYDKLELYNGIFMLLYDRRNDMASVNFDKTMLLELFDKAYNNALEIQVSESKKYTLTLKEQMTENYSEYKEAIERAYKNNVKG